MKKQLARWLNMLARKLDTEIVIDNKERFKPKTLGVCYHISKADVRKYRKAHAEYKSHREALDALINDTKGVILGSIARGIREKQIIDYQVRKSLWTADVSGTLNVYVREDRLINEE